MAESSITAPVIVSGLRVPGSSVTDQVANGPLNELYKNRFKQIKKEGGAVAEWSNAQLL